MKQIFISALLFCAVSLQAQTVNDIPLKDIDVEYVQILGTSKFMSTKLTIEIDFGQQVNFISFGKETQLKDADGKKLVFNSMIDALNFMSANGYDFIDANVVTVQNQNVYHFLLKKKK